MLVESWLSMQKTLASVTCMHRIKPGVVLHASCNPSTQEVEVGGPEVQGPLLIYRESGPV